MTLAETSMRTVQPLWPHIPRVACYPHWLYTIDQTSVKATCNSCSKVLLHDKPGTHPIDPEKSEQDFYRQRIHDVMIKHGVGSTEFSKMIKEIEKVTTKATNAICMHCGSAQGKIFSTNLQPSKKKDKGNTNSTLAT